MGAGGRGWRWRTGRSAGWQLLLGDAAMRRDDGLTMLVIFLIVVSRGWYTLGRLLGARWSSGEEGTQAGAGSDLFGRLARRGRRVDRRLQRERPRGVSTRRVVLAALRVDRRRWGLAGVVANLRALWGPALGAVRNGRGGLGVGRDVLHVRAVQPSATRLVAGGSRRRGEGGGGEVDGAGRRMLLGGGREQRLLVSLM